MLCVKNVTFSQLGAIVTKCL